MLRTVILLVFFQLFESREILRDQSDIKVKSPRYPDNYPPHSNQTWRFRHQYGIWSVNAEQFNLEPSDDCSRDYLEISEFSHRHSERHCGVKSGSLYISSGPEIVLKFVSDGSEQQKGFHLEVYHFNKEEDVERELAAIRTQRKAARASVYKLSENKLVHSVVFYSLLGLFGIAMIILVVLVAYYVYNNRRRQHSQNTKQYHQNIVYHTPAAGPKTPRKYSKSKDNAADRLPTRYV